MHGPMHQLLILHPPDFCHYSTTLGYCLIWVGRPLICPLALFSSLLFDFEASLSHF